MEAVCRGAVEHEAVRSIAQTLARRLEEARQLVEGQPATDAESAYAIVGAAIDEALSSLEQLQLPSSLRPPATKTLWSIAGDWLQRGWLQTRAWSKPRGYAGDYELLAAIFHHHLSHDPLGRLLDRYFQQQAAPRAVRNRMALAGQWIGQLLQPSWQPAGSHIGPEAPERCQRVPPPCPPAFPSDQPCDRPQGRAKVAIVGSATGLEVRLALADLPATSREQLEVVLLDYDPAALAYAERVLSGWLPTGQLHTVATNLARLPKRQPVWEHAPCHLVLVPGLLDYLDEPAAAALVAWGAKQLAPGGRLIAFQFAPHNPTRPYMEWIGDWRLIYRDPGELAALARRAGLREQTMQIAAEPLGVNLFLSLVRP
jgi:hypothetical protein